MLVGRDRMQVFRKGRHNRDGDAPWNEVGVVTRCNIQVQGLQGSEGAVRSDGVNQYAVMSDAVLYLWDREDIRKGDRVVNTADGNVYLVNTDLIAHTYPSGTIAGWKCFMDNAEKW